MSLSLIPKIILYQKIPFLVLKSVYMVLITSILYLHTLRNGKVRGLNENCSFDEK